MTFPHHHRSPQPVVNTDAARSGVVGVTVCDGASAFIVSGGTRLKFIPVRRVPVIDIHAALQGKSRASFANAAENSQSRYGANTASVRNPDKSTIYANQEG